MLFAQLIWSLGRPGDILFAISSASGNLEMCSMHFNVAKSKWIILIHSWVYRSSSSKMRDHVDAYIGMPEDEVYNTQELHLSIYHTLLFSTRGCFFGNGSE